MCPFGRVLLIAIPVAACQASTTVESFEIGPDGGELTTTDGFSLEIPPGALAATTRIQIETVTAPLLDPGFEATSAFHAIEPDDLVFALPATARIAAPDTAGVMMGVVTTAAGYDLAEVDTQPTDRMHRAATAVGVSVSGATRVGLATAHVSLAAATASYLGNAAHRCNSAIAETIADQLVAMRQVQTPRAALVAIDADVDFYEVPAFLRLLQADAATSLRDVATTAGHRKIVISAAYRTVANQYVLAHNPACKDGTARIFHSNHSSGFAVDVSGMTDEDNQPAVHWFEDSGAWCWRDHDATVLAAMCTDISDRVHFEHFASIEETDAATRAFVDLWNCSNPRHPISTTDTDDVLEAALGKSPVDGFLVAPIDEPAADVCPFDLPGPLRVGLLVGDTTPLGARVVSSSGKDLHRALNVTADAPNIASSDGTQITAHAVGTTVLHVSDPKSDLTLAITVTVGAHRCGQEVCTAQQTCEDGTQDPFCCGPCDPGETCSDCGCIPSTDKCCLQTGGDPEVEPAAEPCCEAHFKCTGDNMMLVENASVWADHCCYMLSSLTHECPAGYLAIGFSGAADAQDQNCHYHQDVVFCHPSTDPLADCWQGPTP